MRIPGTLGLSYFKERDVEEATIQLEARPAPGPNGGKPHTRRPSPANSGLDRFLLTAKRVVAENYNSHRRPEQVEIPMRSVCIESYTRMLNNWRATVGSPLAKNLLWIVTYDGDMDVIYIEYYKRVTNVVIELGAKE